MRKKMDLQPRPEGLDAPRKKPTIKDIAAAAGVCYATAARVLSDNKNYYIAEETRKAILDAAARLHYFPNPFAQSLKTNRSNIIGLCIHQFTPQANLRPAVYPVIHVDPRLQGIYQHPFSTQYNMMIITRNDDLPINEQEMIRKIAMLDGMIFISPKRVHRDLLLRIAQEIPLVAEDAEQVQEICSVSVDQARAIYDCVALLAQRGCRRIGMVTHSSPQVYFYNQERNAGFMKAITELNLPFSKQQLTHSELLEGDYYRRVDHMLRSVKGLDGLIVTRDKELLEALEAIRNNGRRVGEDLLLISVNETEICRFLQPSITAVQFPSSQVASKAFDLLLERIQQPDSPPQHYLVRAALHERESTHPHWKASDGRD